MKKRKEQKELSTIMTRRMLMLGAGQGVLGALLVGRLYQLQIAQSEGYRRLSDNNQFDRRLVLAPRGRILDRKGRLLAGNSEVFELRMLPSRISNHQAWLKRVSQHFHKPSVNFIGAYFTKIHYVTNYHKPGNMMHVAITQTSFNGIVQRNNSCLSFIPCIC